MLEHPGMAELSIILLGFMIVVLAGGVWIAVTLGLVGLVAMALTTTVPIGSVLLSWLATARSVRIAKKQPPAAPRIQGQ